MGSRAYAAMHRNELDRVLGVVIYDSGTGKTTGFSVGGRKDLVTAAQPLIAPLAQFGVTQLNPTMESGTDHFDFMLEGVPTFVADQEESNYLTSYHASSDTFDKVDLPQLKKHVAEAAYMSFALANLPSPLGPRLSRAEVEKDMKETHLDQELKDMGMWDEWVKGTRGRQK
jgi:Zn-dependent M28 family amino/carboxypeptidase